MKTGMHQVDMPRSVSTEWSVAYVMTHYPAVALTFIAGEIDQIEREGGQIFPIAINTPAASDLKTDAAQRRHGATLYLKKSKRAILATTLRCFLYHPLSFTRLAHSAIRTARADVALIIRRLVHLSYATLVAEECRNRSISHIHAQFGQAPATVAWFATEISNFRRGGQTRWSFTIHGFQDFVDETVARLDLKSVAAHFVVCVSDFTKSQLCRIAPVERWRRIHVIRCGIDLDAFRVRDTRPLGQPPRIIIVGRLSPEKGHLVLFQAVAALRMRGIHVAVEVVGGGSFERALRAEVAELALQDRIQFTGELESDHVRQRLGGADVFCLASFAEGLPISIMEAMAVGVPVVTTWIAGIPELAIDRQTALTVAPGDAAALADALELIVTDGALRSRLTVAARAAVEERHRRDVNVGKLAELFRQSNNTAVLGGPRSDEKDCI
jgi:glycosyltransferase involved in cell wall biosynthesis